MENTFCPLLVNTLNHKITIRIFKQLPQAFFCALCHDLLASEMPENGTFSLSFEFIS